ncbi:E2/UBC family protein [Variovorax sp. GB1R11]|uniref:E2/UBC family protein n=1 Tax=Variovorax sp. GB1R11 TaxID=3443741 RepID=UPI003F4775F2
MSLPASEMAFLTERGSPFQVLQEGGMNCLLLPKYRLPAGFTVLSADLLLRLNLGYPDVPPDMWWFEPAVLRADGRVIANTDVFEDHLGRRWQRWSRHLNPDQWLAGRDSLESFLALIDSDLRKSVSGCAQ